MLTLDVPARTGTANGRWRREVEIKWSGRRELTFEMGGQLVGTSGYLFP